MANVFDLAEYIMSKKREISTINLSNLAYYCQAWCLVCLERPLFHEEIQAWEFGPAIPALFEMHDDVYEIDPSFNFGGDPNNFTHDEKDVIDFVLDKYGNQDTWKLSDHTQCEKPWIAARRNTPNRHVSSNVISHLSMFEYYLSIL